VIAQVNPLMPRIEGKARISVRKIEYFIEHAAQLPETTPGIFNERHERIGRYAAQLVEDGATLQVGLGNSPEAVVRALHKHRHLGIHTGMLNDALMDLVRGGAVDHSAKSYRPGKMVASHVLGSAVLYQFAGESKDLELHPSDWVNDPQRIARNDRMVAINGARQIDLTGQVVRDSSGHHFHGGIGALQDFIRGAGRSKNGRPIIVLPSTEDADGQSRIVAGLESGSGVCTGRGDVHHVVTEYGVATLHGRSIRERVARMVVIAHPDLRESLLEGAHGRGWLPRFFTMPRSESGAGEIESARVDFKGRRYFLRPLHPSDMRALQEFFYSHDEETVRLRYGYVKAEMTGESAFKLAAVDPEKDRALGIFKEQQGRQEIKAIGRYYSDPRGNSAEVAFVVHEGNRQLGMAGFLLGELAITAASRGIEEFWASVLTENHAMAALFTAVGGRMDDEGDFRMSVSRIIELRKGFLGRKGISKID
jgi:RimJ/RimL family protein N-acetyltransferase